MSEGDIQVVVLPDKNAMSQLAADVVSDALRSDPASAMALPTGSTPLGMFNVLIARSRAGAIDLSQMQLFCLDEYVGVDIADPNTLTSWLMRSFIVPAGIPLDHIHTLPVRDSDLVLAAHRYEEEMAGAGGLRLAVLGLGDNGHIAYNEPGSDADSRTRVVELTQASIEQAHGYFAGHDVPTTAMTVGVGTLLDADRVLLIVSGEGKREILRSALQGPITSDVPASFLRLRPERVTVISDEAAAALLD